MSESNRQCTYIRADLVIERHAESAVDVLNKNVGTTAHLREADLRLLEECSPPRTIAEYCAEFCGPEATQTQLRRCSRALKQLATRGLLRKVAVPAEYCAGGRGRRRKAQSIEHAEPDANPGTSATEREVSLVIPTEGRIEATIRLVRSMDETATLNTDTALYLVVDANASHKGADPFEDISHLIGERKSDTFVPGEIHYLETLANRMSLTEQETDALRFGLFGDDAIKPTVGATQNHAFLLNTAPQLISIDDDVLCRGVTGDLPHAGTVSARNTAVEFRYWKDREAILREYAPKNMNLRTAIEPILGRRVADLFADEIPMTIDLNHLTPNLNYRLECRDPRVAAVVFGTIGDGGMGDKPMLMTDSMRVPQLFSSSESDQELALTSRELTRIAEYPLITSHPFFMTTACAFHTADLLPPFFPFGRGQDGLFGTMLTQVFEDALIGHLPGALLHAPLDDRTSRQHSLPDHISLSVCRTLTILAGVYGSQSVGGTRSERLEDLGSWLCDHSEARPEVFRDWITSIVLKSFLSYDRAIERSYYPGAAEGQTLRDRTICALRADIQRRVSDSDILPIAEYHALGLDADATIERMAHDFSLFGRFLQIWPRVWEFAREHPLTPR